MEETKAYCPSDGIPEDHMPKPITMTRKKELIAFAEQIVADVLSRVPVSRERCFLNQAVSMFLDR